MWRAIRGIFVTDDGKGRLERPLQGDAVICPMMLKGQGSPSFCSYV